MPADSLTRVFDGETVIYRNESALPRAYVVPRATIVDGATEALATVLSSGFDPRRQVVLERDGPNDSPAPVHGGAVTGEASIVEYTDDRVIVEADATGDAWMVLGDTYYPGWSATVNGLAAPIERANYVLRAIRIPAGTSRVEFVYRPVLFRVGAAVTLGALVVVLIGGALRSRRRVPSLVVAPVAESGL
jgi:hypothetical protein